jgi:hypothetical protein
MIVLDSNVISALMSSPAPSVILWLDAQPPQSLWTTSICVYEIEYGLHSLPKGKRKKGLQEDFERALQVELQGRILDFDAEAARAAGLISADLRRAGRPIDVRDAMIAGIVSLRRATLATRNTKHFQDTQVSLVNPWDHPVDLNQ